MAAASDASSKSIALQRIFSRKLFRVGCSLDFIKELLNLLRLVRDWFGQPCVARNLSHARIDCVTSQVCQIQHTNPAASQPHVDRAS